MRERTTRNSQSVTLRLVSDTVSEREYASPSYGGGNHPSIISLRTQNQQLSELVSTWEKQVESLQSKYLEAFATLSIDTTTQPVVPLDIVIDEDGTNAGF